MKQMGGKTHSGSVGHTGGKNACCRYLKWTLEDLLPCYCYAIKANS